MGSLTALAYVLIIGTPSRFHRGKQIGTYVGMISSEDSSGGKQRLGHISKHGNSLLRFLLVEAAQVAGRINPDWRRRYLHLAMRRHKSIAKVALGRRQGVRLYWMGRNGCEHSPSLEFGSYAGLCSIRTDLSEPVPRVAVLVSVLRGDADNGFWLSKSA